MRAVLEDIFASLVDQGIDRLIVLNGHGGNVEPVNDVTRPLYRRCKVLVPSLYLQRIGYALLPEILGPETAKRASGHGADPLTSVYWHLFPDLVLEPIAPGRVLDLPMAGFGTVSFEGAEVSVPVAVDEISPNAVLHGDARLSSPEDLAAEVRGPEQAPLNPLFASVGENTLKSCLRSHPDVAQRHYADLVGAPA